MMFVRRRDSKGFIRSMVVLLATVATLSYRAEAQQVNVPALVLHYADIVLYNGKILTADDKFSTAEAVAIRDNKFLAVGKTADIVPLAGPNTRKVDLKGKTVTPGIVDVHQHPFTYGMMTFFKQKHDVQWEGELPELDELERNMDLSGSGVDLFMRDVKRATAVYKPGELIGLPNQFGRGMGEGLRLCRFLTLQQLDAASPNNPVIVFQPVNLWSTTMNSKTAEMLHLPAGTPAFVKEDSPCPSQEAILAITDYVHWQIPLEEKLPAYRYAQRRANRYGITMVKEHTAPPIIAGIRELWKRGELTVRERMPIPLDPHGDMSLRIPPGEAEAFFKRIGNYSGIGDDMWRFVNVRPDAVGGNMITGTSWTFEPKLHELPYAPNMPYGVPGLGARQEPKKEKDIESGEIFGGREAMIQAIRYGWDVSFDHTVGDRSVSEVLKAIEEGLKNQVVKRPDQIITINHTPMARIQEIQKMAALGVRPSVGPWHVFMDYMLEATVLQYGTERVGQMIPMKSFVKSGLKPALEGDTLYTPPFWRMEKIITRKDDKYKRVFGPVEKVTRQEALWMSTLWGAYNLGEDKKLGSIETGKLADLIVVDKDYVTTPEDEISKINVLLTVVNGKVVYEVEGGLQ